MEINEIRIGDIFMNSKSGDLKIVFLSSKELAIADLKIFFSKGYNDFRDLMKSGDWEKVGNCSLSEKMKILLHED